LCFCRLGDGQPRKQVGGSGRHGVLSTTFCELGLILRASHERSRNSERPRRVMATHEPFAWAASGIFAWPDACARARRPPERRRPSSVPLTRGTRPDRTHAMAQPRRRFATGHASHFAVTRVGSQSQQASSSRRRRRSRRNHPGGTKMMRTPTPAGRQRVDRAVEDPRSVLAPRLPSGTGRTFDCWSRTRL